MQHFIYDTKALLDVLEKEQAVNYFLADLFLFEEIRRKKIEIEEFLFNTTISLKNKIEYADSVLKPYFAPNFYGLLLQLLKNDDILAYDSLRHKLLELLETEKNYQFTEIVSAFPLTDRQIWRIKELLMKLSGKHVFLYNTVSDQVIGGFLIRWGEQMIDLSVAGTFQKIKTEVLHTITE